MRIRVQPARSAAEGALQLADQEIVGEPIG
jgi:hypothetical protein